MSVTYSIAAINERLEGVITAIDGGGGPGNFKLLSGGTTLSTIQLATPCGTVSGGVLTFTGPLTDASAANTGLVDNVRIEDSTGAVMISGFTVGIPLSGQEVIISNGFNSTLISSGQSVQLLSAQITGS